MNIRENHGITLVMLIVTIVVLLILSGITISAITGRESTIDKASQAKNETEIKEEMEKLQEVINQSASKGIRHGNFSGSADSQTIRDALKKNKLIEENPDDVIVDGKNGWKVTGVKTGQKYKIKYDGEITRIEELAPTKIWGKIADGILYLRATEQGEYTKGTKWNDSTITKVIIEEPIAPTTCYLMFKDCTKLLEIENIEYLHTENVKSMYGMFFGCNKLTNLDISNFDTSNVTSMTYMFYDCQSIEKLNFSNFDTSNLESFDVVFYNCKKIKELNLTSINISKVNSLSNMFNSCTDLKKLNISNWDTALVQNMSQMFYNCKNLEELDLRSFDTNNVTNMVRMFAYCNELKKILVSNKFVTDKVLFEQIPNKPNVETYASYLFTGDSNLIGGAGTKYNSSCTDKTYARIDNPPTKPGYFTLK